MRKVLYLFGFGLLFLCLLPVLLALLGLGVASVAGCAVDASTTHPCLILGADLGETLYTLTMLHWFGLITLPLAVVPLLLILLMALVDLIRYLRR